MDLSRFSNNSEVKDLYGDKQKVLKPLESFLGMDENFNLYFSQKDFYLSLSNKNNEILYMYSIGGRLLNNIYANYEINAQYVSTMFFSPNGRVYSYLVKDGYINFILIN